MSKKDKKAGMPKDSWRFDPKVDSAVTFAVNHVLVMATDAKNFTLKERVNFTSISFTNLLEICNYVQANVSEYSMNRWQKSFKWALDEIATTVETLENEDFFQECMKSEVHRFPPSFEELPNLYSEVIIDYLAIYAVTEEVSKNRAYFTQALENALKSASVTYNAKPGINLMFSSKSHRRFKIAYETDTGTMNVTVPKHVWELWAESKKIKPAAGDYNKDHLVPNVPYTTDFLHLLDSRMDPGKYDQLNAEPRYVLIHNPYDDFQALVHLVQAAAKSKFTKAMGMTCYRLAEDSKFIDAFIEASHRGIECYLFIELKARGEIDNHLAQISKCLKQANLDHLHLKYDYSDVKVHGKMIYIDYENPQALMNKRGTISVFSTGNYNETTAKRYTDYHYITTDYGVAKLIHRNFDTIWDSSQQMLSSISGILLKEIYAECAKGKKGRIWIQVNHLDNKMVIKALKEAVRRKVDVRLIVRTTKGFHKKQLKSKTVTGRYLEHGRIYAFGRKDPRVYISSSDVLYRNLYNRFESYVKIQDEDTKFRLLMDFLVLYKFGQPSQPICPKGTKGQKEALDIWYTVARMFKPGSQITAPEWISEPGLPVLDRSLIEEYLVNKHKGKSAGPAPEELENATPQ